MRTTVFRVSFPGIRIRIIDKKGNPCTQPELQRHFHVGYKHVQIDITEDNEFMTPGHWPFKLVYVKPTWNVKLREQCTDPFFAVIQPDEIVIGVGHRQDVINGLDVELIVLFLYEVGIGYINMQPIYLPHRAQLRLPAK